MNHRIMPLVAAIFWPYLALCQASEEINNTALQEEASKGAVHAQLELGLALTIENSDIEETMEGIKWLFAAADQGSWQANLILGRIFLGEWPMPRDEARASMLLEEAARLGSHAAFKELADLRILSGDYAGSVPWLKRASAVGDTASTRTLGFMLLQGQGTKKDPDAAVKLLTKAALAGDSKAQYSLAFFLKAGKYLEKNSDLADFWYSESAKRGNSSAIAEVFGAFSVQALRGESSNRFSRAQIDELAESVPEAKSSWWLLVYLGLGVEKNPDQAVIEWHLLAKQGDTFAQHKLYEHYASTDQMNEAAIHLIAAAKAGNPAAQYDYARRLLDGRMSSVLQDEPLGVEWLKRAEQTNNSAKVYLALLMVKGQLVEQDTPAGLAALDEMATYLDVEAVFSLARLYESGTYVPRDYSKALSYWEQAAELSAEYVANGFAWFLATCPDETIRDGKKALSYAKLAVELQPDSPSRRDTLAAAYAASGDFEQAAIFQRQAIELASQAGLNLDRYEHRQKLYEQETLWGLHDQVPTE